MMGPGAYANANDGVQGRGLTMRILLAGDTHGNTGHVRRLLDAAAAADVDAIFQLGDFGYWEHEASGIRYLDAVNRSARSRGVDVYFLDGNHDKTSLLTECYGDSRDEQGFLIVRPRVRYAPRGHRWSWRGIRFLAFGGALSLDRDQRLAEERRRYEKALRKEGFRLGAGRPPGEVPDFAGSLWFPEEQADDADVDAILTDRAPVDVLLTHDKPLRTAPAFNRKGDPRCLPNQERVQRLVDAYRPTLAAHGHLHFRYTEELAHPDGSSTRVEGLAADPMASYDVPGYHVPESWLVVDLADLVPALGAGPVEAETGS
ncbi:metallophosphoesterase [Embleya sp. NBC_00896]|uniref:metallophosphoesterase family protein n=1 Tax=Embleya sp. NBC_00896 TaxID=2975961 RepID=UPI003866798E|nr:metallophosphoesterase [Embleya sp. NBC_00896]